MSGTKCSPSPCWGCLTQHLNTQFCEVCLQLSSGIMAAGSSRPGLSCGEPEAGEGTEAKVDDPLEVKGASQKRGHGVGLDNDESQLQNRDAGQREEREGYPRPKRCLAQGVQVTQLKAKGDKGQSDSSQMEQGRIS